MKVLFTDFVDNDGIRYVGFETTKYYEFNIYTSSTFPYSTYTFKIRKDYFKFDFFKSEEPDYIYKLMRDVDYGYLEGAYLFNWKWYTTRVIRNIITSNKLIDCHWKRYAK